MAQTIQDLVDRYVFGNDDGTWTVWKHSSDAAGPGYIGKATFRSNGAIVCGTFVNPGVTLNDPRIQGLGIAGWHHYRKIPNEPNIWNKGWDFGGHKQAGGDPFGVSSSSVLVVPYFDANGFIRASFRVDFVDRYSAAEGKRVMSVRYDYIVEPSDVKLWVSFTEFPDGFDSGPQPFLKEPKLCFGVGASSYTPVNLDLFDHLGSTLRSIDLNNDPRLQDPTVGTVQMGFDNRARLRFYDNDSYLNIVARGNNPLVYGADQKVTSYETRSNWEFGPGMDAWAADANSRSHFDDSVCAAYCLQGPGGTLTRQWEIAKRHTEHATVAMLHAWEGGSGMPDCLCASRAFKSGNTWTTYLSISQNAGWVL
jgi:hypothetical protein